MGTSLSGLTPQNTYQGLLKFGDNSAISASLKAISDGAGNDTMLELSTTALQIGGTTGLFWDNTNKRLGVGFNSPTARMQIRGSGDTSATIALLVQNSTGNPAFTVTDNRSSNFEGLVTFSSNVTFRGANDTQSLLNMRFVVPGATKTFLINKDYANSPSASALLQVDSTTQGFLPPRMTTTQKNAISSPAAGLVVYDNTINRASVYSTAWENVITEVNASPNAVSNVWSGSQAQYDALTPNASTLYFIV
jgi:hypothetical protein